jgi:hypothetical protein
VAANRDRTREVTAETTLLSSSELSQIPLNQSPVAKKGILR